MMTGKQFSFCREGPALKRRDAMEVGHVTRRIGQRNGKFMELRIPIPDVQT